MNQVSPRVSPVKHSLRFVLAIIVSLLSWPLGVEPTLGQTLDRNIVGTPPISFQSLAADATQEIVELYKRGVIPLISVAGTNTITATTVPPLTGYFNGQMFLLRPAANNTTAVTLNISGLGAKPVQSASGGTLASGDLQSSTVYWVSYQLTGDSFRLSPTTTGATAAPTGAEYLVGLLDGALSAERVVTNSATVSWDLSVAGQAISNVIDNSISNSKIRDGVARSVIGRFANSTGDPADIAGAGLGTWLGDDGTTAGFRPMDLITTDLSLTGLISPPLITATQNDFNPTGLATATILNLSSNASQDITGLVTNGAGRYQILYNGGAQPIVLKNENAGSAAANRFGFGGTDLTLAAGTSATILYNSITSRWNLLATGTTAAVTGVSDGDKGDITVTGSGLVWTIDPLAVTYSKIQNVNNDRILCRDTTGAGVIEECAVTGGLEFTGAVGIQRSALTGDITALAGTSATTIANNVVSDAKLRQGTARSVIGRSANSTGNVADISGGGATTFLSDDGSTLAFRIVDTVPSNFSLTGDISPAQITANQNDYAPAGFATASILRLSSDASRNITGLAGGSDGRSIVVRNIGAQDIVLTDQDVLSAAANRFKFGASLTLAPSAGVILNYDSTDLRWYKSADTIAGGGGAAPTGASYLTLGLDATLTAERVLTAGTSMSFVDAGVNSTLTVDVSANGITDAKLRQGVGTSVIGRSAGTTGNVADIVSGADNTVLARSGGTLAFQSVVSAMITDNTIADADIRQSAALSVHGRSANSTGNLADIVAAVDGDVLRRSGTTLGFGQIDTAGIAGNAVTDTKLRDSGARSVIGRSGNSTGDPADISGTGAGTWLGDDGSTVAFRPVNILSQDFSRSGDISPAQLTANTDDYAPAGFSTASVLRLSTDASRNLTGLAGGTDGRVITIFNVGSFNLVIKNDVTSSPANRFFLNADVTLQANQAAAFIYDSSSSRWRGYAVPASLAGALTNGDKGDITVSGTQDVWTIDPNVVTFAKMQQVATDSLLGRDTAATGNVENILLNTTLSMDGSGNLQRAALTGDVTASAGSNATTVAADAVALGVDTTGNYQSGDTAGTGIAIVQTPAEGFSPTISFNYADQGADPALNADECVFSGDATVNGEIVCEGDTADAFETRIVVTDPTADRAFTIPNANSVAVVPGTCSTGMLFSSISASGVITCSFASESMCMALGDETTSITTGTKITWTMPYAFTVTSVTFSLTMASSSGTPTLNILEDTDAEGGSAAATIFSTKPTIDANERRSSTAAVASVISDSSLAANSEMSAAIDVAGTGAKGAKLCLVGHQ